MADLPDDTSCLVDVDRSEQRTSFSDWEQAERLGLRGNFAPDSTSKLCTPKSVGLMSLNERANPSWWLFACTLTRSD